MKVGAVSFLLILAALGIGTKCGWPQQPVPPPPAREPEIKLTPAEIELYKKAQSLIDWTPTQIRHSPDLKYIEPAAGGDPLPDILDRVGKTVIRLFDDFPRVSCDEELTSDTRIRPPRHGDHSRGDSPSLARQKFRYVIVPGDIGGIPAFEEYRTDLDGKPVDVTALQGFLMVTSNFASSFLYLSPTDQHDSHLRYFGIQFLQDRKCYVVGFAQDPDRPRRASALYNLPGEGYGVLVQGLAWIDSQNFQVLRVTSWLLAPRDDIGLESMISTVDFRGVRLTESAKELWLPGDVSVDVVYHGMRIHNTHHYSNFKLFRVNSAIKP
jgi:hypothetical protein